MYNCPEIKSKYTGHYAREFKPHVTSSQATTKKNNKNNHKEHQQPRHVKKREGAVWIVTPPMNECMGVSVREMSIPTQLDQEFINV